MLTQRCSDTRSYRGELLFGCASVSFSITSDVNRDYTYVFYRLYSCRSIHLQRKQRHLTEHHTGVHDGNRGVGSKLKVGAHIPERSAGKKLLALLPLFI